MKDAIRTRALELGFDDCRFTTARPPASAPNFERWIADGRHGDMGYLARNAPKRVEPQRVLEGARSVICLVASYAGAVSSPRFQVSGAESAPDGAKPKPETRDPRPGIIARYARFRDYHDVLGERSRELAAFVDALGGSGTRSLWYVDTGPVLERDLAQRAGAGFIGKHTNLINRALGNWFFLAEILTTLELEPDASERNRCGTCTRCITACPTRAITAPFELDARLCISYLTIELKGSIPVELRPAMGARIFGCDDCLEVCPWNRFAREGRMMKAHARADLAQSDLLELLALDDAAFKQRFAGTPILRTKRRGLLRNVCVALGNTGHEDARPALLKATRDPEPLIAEHARWATAQIEHRAADGRG
ncbi:MAG: tRNA epoxyqueuosine(34) reductase QueG [Verrucomicrobia bacterium]|nr:tRNA epoxyqueuosine(34) reductase QueG [Verrucomicrobiota bacterium]